MAVITNLGRRGLDFTIGSENGKPIVEHIRAGETRDIPVNVNSAEVRGRFVAGLILVAGLSRGPRKLADIPVPPVALIAAASKPAPKRRARRK